MLGRGALSGVVILPLPLPRDEEEREQVRAEQQELRGPHGGEGGAGERAQRHAGGHDERLEERDALEHERVGRHQGRVGGAPGAELPPEKEGGREPRRDDDRRERGRRRDREPPRRERPQPLLGMRAVALAVHDVVEDVDAARDDAEGGDARRRPDPAGGRAERAAEEERQRQHQVLDPLLGPHRGRQRAENGQRTPASDSSADAASPDAVAVIYLILNASSGIVSRGR